MSNKNDSKINKANQNNGIAKQITAEEALKMNLPNSIKKTTTPIALQLKNTFNEAQLPNKPSNGLMIKNFSIPSKSADSKDAELYNTKTVIKPDKNPPSKRTR